MEENKKVRITLDNSKNELSAIVAKVNFRIDKAFLSNCVSFAYNSQTLFTYYLCGNDMVCLFRGENIQDVYTALEKYNK